MHDGPSEDFEKGGGLNLESIFFVPKLSELDGDAEQTCATQPLVYHKRGVWG